MANRKLSRREWILLTVVCCVAAGWVYYLARLKPLLKDISAAERQVAARNAATNPPERKAFLMKQKETLKIRLAATGNDLLQLEKRFAGLKRPEEVQKLKLRISELAERCGMVVRKSAPYAAEKSQNRRGTRRKGMTTAGRFENTDLRNRRLEKFVVEATFAGLRKFVLGLHMLEQQVTIASIDIKSAAAETSASGEAESASESARTLVVTMILAL